MIAGRRTSIVAGVLVLVVTAACGADPAAPSGPVALRLAPDAAPSITPPVTVWRGDLVEEADAWSIDAERHGVAYPAEHALGQGEPLLVLGSLAPDRPLELVHRVEFDPAGFNQVHVTGAFDGQGHVIALFLRDGEPVGRSGTERVPVLGEPIVLALDVPPALPAFDALALRFEGAWLRIGLRSVALVRASAGSLLPDPADGPRLVRIGDETRRGVGVVPGRPVRTELVVPAHASLSFSYGAPRATLGGPEGGVLSVTLGADGVPQRFGWSGETPRWRHVDVPLDEHAGRRLRVTFAVEAAEGGGCVLAAPRVGTAQARPPTVALITSDTHRGDHLGVTGLVATLSTPTLDALAARGTWFSDCFAPINNTNPSHIALMTATHPRDTGILRNNAPLASVAETLAERFHQAGYVTMAAVSASHLGPDASGLGQGFERVSWPSEHHERPADETVDVVERWLPDAEGRPLFVWLHVFDPHWPYEPPRAQALQYVDPDEPLPNDHEVAFALYRAEVSHVDAQLGRLLGAGRLREGLVAFVGDHGESFGQRGVWFTHHGLFSTLHVPLVIAGPGVPVGTRVDRPVSSIDLARTLLDRAGLPAVPFPGRDLFAPADSAARAPDTRYALSNDALAASITEDGLHLVLQLEARVEPSFANPLERHAMELYDLRADPECTTDLVPSRPEDAAILRARLIAWLEAAEPRGWVGESVADPALEEALAQLGYTTSGSSPQGSYWVPDDCAHCRSSRH